MRDRLIELLTDNLPRCGNLPHWDNPLQLSCDEQVERIADHLLANGVTVQEWISVKDRLPQGADGKSLCESVLAYLNNREVVGQVCTGWLSGDKWYLTVGEDDYYTVWGLGAVTHWMPLPQPPKGE